VAPITEAILAKMTRRHPVDAAKLVARVGELVAAEKLAALDARMRRRLERGDNAAAQPLSDVGEMVHVRASQLQAPLSDAEVDAAVARVRRQAVGRQANQGGRLVQLGGRDAAALRGGGGGRGHARAAAVAGGWPEGEQRSAMAAVAGGWPEGEQRSAMAAVAGGWPKGEQRSAMAAVAGGWPKGEQRSAMAAVAGGWPEGEPRSAMAAVAGGWPEGEQRSAMAAVAGGWPEGEQRSAMAEPRPARLAAAAPLLSTLPAPPMDEHQFLRFAVAGEPNATNVFGNRKPMIVTAARSASAPPPPPPSVVVDLWLEVAEAAAPAAARAAAATAAEAAAAGSGQQRPRPHTAHPRPAAWSDGEDEPLEEAAGDEVCPSCTLLHSSRDVHGACACILHRTSLMHDASCGAWQAEETPEETPEEPEATGRETRGEALQARDTTLDHEMQREERSRPATHLGWTDQEAHDMQGSAHWREEWSRPATHLGWTDQEAHDMQGSAHWREERSRPATHLGWTDQEEAHDHGRHRAAPATRSHTGAARSPPRSPSPWHHGGRPSLSAASPPRSPSPPTPPRRARRGPAPSPPPNAYVPILQVRFCRYRFCATVFAS
jgi:hypothetical protein